MTPMLSRPQTEPLALPAPAAQEAAFLNHLRSTAMQCRIKPRSDLFEACALLQTTRNATREAYSAALMRSLDTALGQRARMLSPGEAERSFDEDWLLSLARACARGDDGSAAFLLGRRVPRESARLIRFLVGRIASCFSLD